MGVKLILPTKKKITWCFITEVCFLQKFPQFFVYNLKGIEIIVICYKISFLQNLLINKIKLLKFKRGEKVRVNFRHGGLELYVYDREE